VASLVFGAGRLRHEAGGLRPSLASPAPTSLARPHQPRLPPLTSAAPMAKGEHQVKTANNSFVDAEGCGTITFYVDRPNAKPAEIVLQHVLYVPACGVNDLLSIIQLMRKGVNFDFKLDGATGALGQSSSMKHRLSIVHWPPSIYNLGLSLESLCGSG